MCVACSRGEEWVQQMMIFLRLPWIGVATATAVTSAASFLQSKRKARKFVNWVDNRKPLKSTTPLSMSFHN